MYNFLRQPPDFVPVSCHDLHLANRHISLVLNGIGAIPTGSGWQ